MAEEVRNLLDQMDLEKNSDLVGVVEAAKKLRGLVGKSPETYQPLVLANDGFILANFLKINDLVMDQRCSESDMRVWLQLVHNLCVKQPQFSVKAFDQLRAFILTSLTSCDLKTANVAGAIILQAIINGGCSTIGDPLEVVDGLLASLQVASGEGSQSCEFPYLALLKLVGSIEHHSLDEFATKLPDDHRLALYEVVCENGEVVTENALRFVTAQFKRRATLLFVTMKSREPVDPREVVYLLEVICKSCSEDSLRTRVLQTDKSLLIDTMYLLRMVHESGREHADGMFGIRPKLDDVRDTDGNMATDPVFGFKRDLVRLLANLCHECLINQEEVREHKGIELLLDCSQADGRNPLITQWVVLAVRNLCQDNPANQEVIRAIEAKGKMDQDLMDQVGVQIKHL